MSCWGFRFLYDTDLIRSKAVERPARGFQAGRLSPLELGKAHQGHMHFIGSISRASSLIASDASFLPLPLPFGARQAFCLLAGARVLPGSGAGSLLPSLHTEGRPVCKRTLLGRSRRVTAFQSSHDSRLGMKTWKLAVVESGLAHSCSALSRSTLCGPQSQCCPPEPALTLEGDGSLAAFGGEGEVGGGGSHTD